MPMRLFLAYTDRMRAQRIERANRQRRIEWQRQQEAERRRMRGGA